MVNCNNWRLKHMGAFFTALNKCTTLIFVYKYYGLQ